MTDTEWYVVYTTSSGERLAKEDLEGYGYQVFLPVEEYTLRPARHRRDQTPKQVERPLYGRYLFVGLSPYWRDFAGIRRSKRVLAVLHDGYGAPVRISTRTIQGMMADMSRGRFDEAAIRAEKEAQRISILAAQARAIPVGMEFTMQNGLFRNFLATVLRVGKKAVRIEVKSHLGAAIALDVPLLSLEETGVLKIQDDQQKQSASSVG